MTYVVKESEWLLKIAQDHGFRTEQPLLDANPALAQTYGENPNVLPPGLVIEIPEVKVKSEAGMSGTVNHYSAAVKRSSICLTLAESDGLPMAGWKADLVIGGQTWAGLQLDAAGRVVLTRIPRDATSGQLTLTAPDDADGRPAEPVAVALELGAVDPVVAGDVGRRAVQKLLGNLGFYEGPIDGDLEGDTRHALRWFQDEMGLAGDGEPDGLADAPTCGRLIDDFGDDMPAPVPPEPATA